MTTFAEPAAIIDKTNAPQAEPIPTPAQSLALPTFAAVFLDMDGVLADFQTAACIACKQPHPYTGEWDMPAHFGITHDQFWENINKTSGFWKYINPFSHLSQLLSLAAMLSPSVHILSSPARSPDCYSGKRFWQQSYIPAGGPRLILCPAEHKHLLARPDRLLIDDSDKNCEQWRAAGGVAITFPQPWNSARNAAPLGPMFYLAQELGKIKTRQDAPDRAEPVTFAEQAKRYIGRNP